MPIGASIVGTIVTVERIDFDGDERRGLVALVDRERRITVSPCSTSRFPAGRLTGAYKLRLGIA